MATPTLVAGTGTRDITPDAGAVMSGFAIRTEPAVGTHDGLWTRALVLDDGRTRACLVVLDLIGADGALTREIRRAVAAYTGVHPDAVIVCATHTHGGPAVLVGARLGTPDPRYRERVVAASAAAAQDAMASVRPVGVRYAEGSSPGVARNRRDPQGPVDDTVRVVHLAAGRTNVAHLVTFACHPVTLGPDNRLWTRDYPGAVVAAWERDQPGSTAFFLTAPCGQINTGHSAHDSQRLGDRGHRTFERAEAIGNAIAREGERALVADAHVIDGAVAVRRRTVELPYAPFGRPDPTESAAWEAERERVGHADPARAAILTGWIDWATEHAGSTVSHLRSEVATITIGPLVFAFFPGETFVEYGLAIAERYRDRRHVVPVAYAHDAPGYLPHPSAYGAGGYEVDEAHRFYGQPAPFAPEAAQNVERALSELIET